jgi:putative transcriptional regulator
MLSKTQPDTGKILISEPFMMDQNFRRSVVLLVEHSQQGTVGFVLNQETEVTLPDVIPGFPMFDARIRIGGPVQTDSLHFIHRKPNLIQGGIEIGPGIFWGGEFEQLREAALCGKIDINDVMLFLGYSGWSPDQLSEEIETNSWFVSDLNVSDLFQDHLEDLWKSSILKLGNKYAHVANFPENPMWN